VPVFGVQEQEEVAASPRVGAGLTREHISADLAQLLGRGEEEARTEEDMPPLLQVLSASWHFIHIKMVSMPLYLCFFMGNIMCGQFYTNTR